MRSLNLLLVFTMIVAGLPGVSLAGQCGGATQCQPGDTLVASQVMWYDMIDCPGEYALRIIDDNITLDGNGHTIDGVDADPSDGVSVLSARGAEITNLTLTDFADAIDLYYGDTCVISANVISSCEDGISLRWGTGNTLIGNVIDDNSQTGIYMYTTVENEVVRNVISNNGWRGFDLRGTTQDNVIWGNEFFGNPTNATGQTDVINNDWNICGIGNDWDDFSGNSGYPDEYVIAGTGSGTDYFPQVTRPNVTPSPPPNHPGFSSSSCIIPTVFFLNTSMDETSFTPETVKARGQLTGNWLLLNSTYHSVGLEHVDCLFNTDLHAGELVTVTLTDGVECADGSYFPGYQWQYTAEVDENSPGVFQIQYPSPVPMSVTAQSGMKVADMDADGNLDLLIVAPAGDSICFMQGVGNGLFVPGYVYQLDPGNPLFFTIADFNGDYMPDVATSNHGTDDVSILISLGGGFLIELVSYPVGGAPAEICHADFNNDGLLDLAVTNYDDDNVSILLGVGNGTFYPQMLAPTGDSPLGICSGDFNFDGVMDLAVGNTASSENTVSILLGNGDGSFRRAPDVGVGVGPYGLCPGDYNSDYQLDIAVANHADYSVSVLLGVGDGTFTVQAPASVESFPKQIVSGDLDGDGNLDLAVSHTFGHHITLMKGQGDGSFDVETLPTDGIPSCVGAADVDGDNDIDLVASFPGDTLWVMLNESVSCCDIRGDIDNSGVLPIDIADMVYLVDYMFNDGPEPPCWDEGDVDGSGVEPIDIADLVYLVDYQFTGGPPPPACP